MRYFSSFIEECDGGRSMRILDRFLVDEVIISRWGIIGQLIGKRDISDHFPVWLIINKGVWGSKPFLVNNSWFENMDFSLMWSKFGGILLKAKETTC